MPDVLFDNDINTYVFYFGKKYLIYYYNLSKMSKINIFCKIKNHYDQSDQIQNIFGLMRVIADCCVIGFRLIIDFLRRDL